MRLAVFVVLLGLAGHAAADKDDRPKSPALEVLERAIDNQKSKAALAAALAELDGMIAKAPNDSDAYYARGWVLSRTGRNDDAVAAYDRSFELDNKQADAAYNAGVVLGRAGKHKDAAARFERALQANPKHVDAAYNAGQSYYDLDDFANAAARWEVAASLARDDFQIAKKLVQAYVALVKPAKIKEARARVFALRKSLKNDDKNYVYDQFAIGKYHIVVYEAFEPSELLHVFTAKVTLGDKSLGSVNLEVAAGGNYVVGIDHEATHTVIAEHSYKKIPDYPSFKQLVKELIANRF